VATFGQGRTLNHSPISKLTALEGAVFDRFCFRIHRIITTHATSMLEIIDARGYPFRRTPDGGLGEER